MKIAIPVSEGKLCKHFGHCEQFSIITIENNAITKQETLTPPHHGHGVIPNWLAEHGCTDIIAGGMGQAAKTICHDRGIKVLCGAPSLPPEQVASLYLSGELVDSGEACNHHEHAHSCGNH